MKKLFTLIAVAAMAFAAQANVLTVCDNGGYDGYSNHVPTYGFWADTEGTLAQMIYPAAMLTDMAGSEITEVKFYTLAQYYVENGMDPYISNTNFINFENAMIQLSLMKVDQNDFSEVVVGATPVATTIPEVGDMYLTFVLDEPYTYEGGNLLIEAKIIEGGSFGTTYFYGAISGTNPMVPEDCSIYSYVSAYSGTNTYLEDFLPMATFTYEEGGDVPPVDEHAEGVWLVTYDMNGEEIWTEMNESNGDYNVILRCSYGIYGTFDYYGGETRPDIEYYIVVDGVRYGAAEDGTLTVLGEAMQNPLTEGENNYVLGEGLGKVYNMGVAIDEMTGDMYVYAAVAGYTDVNEMNADKAVAGVRYFNMAGQEMKEANGMTIVVTTYTDGTTSAAKVMK